MFRRPQLNPRAALAAKPFHLVAQSILSQRPDGGANLSVPLRPVRWARWLLRYSAASTKTFELDAIGLLVWNSCDGHNSVQQIIRKVAKRYNLGLREAQAPTVSFLRTLVKKGLIGMGLDKPPS